MMDRRKFLGSLIGGVVATAAVRSFPFRVYSFPTEIAKREIITPFIALDPGFTNPVACAVYRRALGGSEFFLIETLSIAEAREKYGVFLMKPIPTKPSELRGATEFDVLV